MKGMGIMMMVTQVHNKHRRYLSSGYLSSGYLTIAATSPLPVLGWGLKPKTYFRFEAQPMIGFRFGPNLKSFLGWRPKEPT